MRRQRIDRLELVHRTGVDIRPLLLSWSGCLDDTSRVLLHVRLVTRATDRELSVI